MFNELAISSSASEVSTETLISLRDMITQKPSTDVLRNIRGFIGSIIAIQPALLYHSLNLNSLAPRAPHPRRRVQMGCMACLDLSVDGMFWRHIYLEPGPHRCIHTLRPVIYRITGTHAGFQSTRRYINNENGPFRRIQI